MTQHKFIGRIEELSFLQKKYTSANAENVILYGRRRIGKTEILLEFCKNKPSIYFLATTDSEQNNIDALQELMARFLDDESFLDIKIDNWVTLFTLFSKFNTHKHKIVLCIDEFPYLVSLNKSILSLFQKIWDQNLKNQNIMLILNGSSISMMEEYALSSNSPFYGRRTGQWNVTEMQISDLYEFFPKYTITEILQVWAILGGVPGYLRQFNPKLSVWDNIVEHILSKGSYLYEEVPILLRDEFREPKNYMRLLQAISLGHTTLGEICNYTGMDKSMISKYLDTLQKTRIVVAKLPITASTNAKKQLYYISDTFFMFWFFYVQRNIIDLEANRATQVAHSIKKDFNSYMGRVFEDVCIRLVRKNLVLRESLFSTIGSWWHKDTEIDIVALNDDSKEILFGECKWQDNVDAQAVLDQLREKSKNVDWNNSTRTESFVIFAKSFKTKIPDCILIDLSAIEKAMRKN